MLPLPSCLPISAGDFYWGLLFMGKIACASNQCYLGSIPFSTDVMILLNWTLGLEVRLIAMHPDFIGDSYLLRSSLIPTTGEGWQGWSGKCRNLVNLFPRKLSKAQDRLLSVHLSPTSCWIVPCSCQKIHQHCAARYSMFNMIPWRWHCSLCSVCDSACAWVTWLNEVQTSVIPLNGSNNKSIESNCVFKLPGICWNLPYFCHAHMSFAIAMVWP